MKFPIFFTSTHIGLDIQPDGIRLLQVKKRRAEILLEHMVHQPFKAEIYVEGKIKHWANLCVELTDCVQLHGLTGKTVTISLPTNLVRMQHLTVPAGLHSKEIEAEIYEHLRRDLIDRKEALAIDFMQIPQPNATLADIFFIAARQEYLSEYVNCVSKSGLKVKVVDVDIYALTRALCLGLQPQAGFKAIIYERHGAALLIIFEQHEILFQQRWNTHESQDFLAQIKTRLQIFQATFGGKDIKQLLIFAQPHFVDILQHAYSVQILNPFMQSNVQFGQQTKSGVEKLADYCIAFGLALREVPKW